MTSEISNSVIADGSNQNEMLFMRGNAISGAPIINGTIQLPKPPISAGIICKEDHDEAMGGGENIGFMSVGKDLQFRCC